VRLRPEPSIRTTSMDDGGLVLLCERSGTLYRCNTTATALWTALHEHDGHADAAAQSVAEQYRTDPARVRADLHRLIDAWRKAGLVRADS
jgi:hypothetical protein